MKAAIDQIIDNRKQRKFVQTIELQITLRQYNVEKDKRFSGTIKLPNIAKPNLKICVIGNAKHCQQAKKLEVAHIDIDGLKTFNNQSKKIKKWAKQFDIILSSLTIQKEITKYLGNTLVKVRRHPLYFGDNQTVTDKMNQVMHSVKFQLKKVLCMGTGVGTVNLTKDQIRQNVNMSINFLVSLLKKGWHNIQKVYIKTTMGKPQKIYG